MAPQSSPTDDDALWRAPLVLALVPLVLLPQLVGGVHPEVAVGAAAIELGALGWFLTRAARAGKSLVVSWMSAPLVIGVVATTLHLVPLPVGVARALSPAAFERTTWMTAMLPDAVREQMWHRLSLDPPESAFAAVRLLGATALFALLADVTRHRQARALLLRALLVTAAALFFVALGHLLLNVNGAWGRFTMKTTPFYAPMVNPNQLGRVFGALSLVLIAHALGSRARVQAAWFAGVGVLCGAGVFLTLSRGAMVAFVGGGAVLVLALLRERLGHTQDDASRTTGLIVGAFALFAASVGVGLYLAREALVREVASLASDRIQQSKIALYQPALTLLDSYATVGVGNNAFGVAFTERAPADLFGGSFTFTHVENIVLATLIEHGVFVGGALILLCCVLAVRLWVGARARRAWTSLPALALLVTGDFFDFALETTAGLFLAAALLALAASAQSGSPGAEPRDRRLGPRGTLPAFGVALVLLALLGRPAVAAWRPRLDRAIADARVEERTALLDHALLAHPADAHYAYQQATASRERADADAALRWANRALVYWPAHAGAHVEAARALAASGHVEQAMLEYRAAWSAHGDRKKLLAEVAMRTDDIALRRSALPEDAEALAALAHDVAREGRRAEAVMLLDDALVLVDVGAGDPRAVPALRLSAAQHLLLLGDPAGASARLLPVVEAGNASGDTVHTYLTAREAEAGTERALEESHAFASAPAAPIAVLAWQLDAFARLNRIDDALRLIEQVKRRASTAADVEVFERREAALHGRQGDRGRQLRILERMSQRHGNDVSLALEVAALQLDLDLVQQARASWARAARVAPAEPAVIELERRIRAREIERVNTR